MMTGPEIVKHIGRLKSERSQYDNLFQDVKRWYAPSSGDFYSPTANTPGDENNGHLFNLKGTLAAERLSQVLYSTVVPIHEQFFTLVPSIEASQELKIWWHKATEVLSSKMIESNLSIIATQALRSLVFFGTTAVYPSFIKGKLSYDTYFPEDIYIDTNYDQEVSVLVTHKLCSAYNLLSKYGPAQVSEQVKDRADKDNPTDIVVYNYFTECPDGSWKLYIVEEATKHIITDYSFTSKPIQVPRWSGNSYEKYGRSPAMRGLPTTKTLNRIEATILRQSEKHVDPPIAIPYDASANAQNMAFDIEPRGIIEFQPDASGGVTLPTPVALGGNIEVGQYQVDKLEKTLDEVFFIDVLTLIMDMSASATATQITAANAEKLDLIIPIVVQLLAEFVKPLVERSFQILIDEGEIEPPVTVEGEELEFDVEVRSSLIIKRRAYQAQGAIQTIQVLGQLAGLNPSVLDRIDLDAVAEHIVINSNLPTDAIRSGKDLEKYRAMKADAAEKADAKEQMAQMVKPIDAQKAAEPNSLAEQIMPGGAQ